MCLFGKLYIGFWNGIVFFGLVALLVGVVEERRMFGNVLLKFSRIGRIGCVAVASFGFAGTEDV